MARSVRHARMHAGARYSRQEMELAAVPGVPLLERSEELARIESAFARARTGRGSFLVIEGPAGIGKTAVLSAARTAAAETGHARPALARSRARARLRLRRREAAVRAGARRGRALRASRLAAGRCGFRRGPAQPPGRRARAGDLGRRRSLVRDPARALLAVRQSRVPARALPRRRRRALGRRAVAALPRLPADTARGAQRRARRRQPAARERGGGGPAGDDHRRMPRPRSCVSRR